jgi:hypothetical protein
MQQSRPPKVVEVRRGFDEETTYDPWHYAPVMVRKPSTKSLIHRHTPSFLIKIKQPRKASAGQKEQLIELSTKSPAGYFDGNMVRGTHGHVGACRQSSAAIPSAWQQFELVFSAAASSRRSPTASDRNSPPTLP